MSYEEIAARGGGILSSARAVASANNATPVSYTHLRAHETVLDLVCRLLLEKKKNDTAIDTALTLS